jgi:hypothetical protein
MERRIEASRTVCAGGACWRRVAAWTLVWVLLCCIGLAGFATACERGPQEMPLKIEKVALFKNGLGFFTSSGTLPGGTASVRMGGFPVPSYGTFWVGYRDKVKVRSLIAAREPYQNSVPAQSIADLLRLNPGCSVRLHIGSDPGEIIEGKIVGDFKRQGGTAASGVLLIKTDKSTVALNVSSITRVDFARCDIVDSTQVEHMRPFLRLELDRPAGGERIGVTYLAKGISWAPSYLIDLSDAENARLSARALIINEAADLTNVKLELVTGFPNIRFAEVHSPIALTRNLGDFLRALTSRRTEPTREEYGLVNQLTLVTGAFAGPYEAPPPPVYSTVVEGQTSEDLFLYPVDDFTLKNGETAWIPLFSAEMPYEHIYTWQVGDYLTGDDRYRSEPDWKKSAEVWHCCRLVNGLDMPLTTASAEFMADGAFVGQDICYYTAPETETTIRINRAMNVLAEETEVEVERTRNAIHVRSSSYDLIKVRGELSLRSRLDNSINLEITKAVSGEILETAPVAEDVQTAEGLRQVNPRHVLTWEVPLEAGEELTLTYTYQVYIRN